MPGQNDNIKKAAEILGKCNYVTVLTGAGISTESGIPDFRSPVTGLWSKVDPEDFTIERFRSHPEVLYKHGSGFFQDIMDAEPNPAHLALGELEEMGLVKSIITQNIDGLHQKGGSKKVFEVHGSLRQGCCMRCDYTEDMTSLIRAVKQGTNPPLCQKCGVPVKPDVTLFGEAMPPAYSEALIEARKADGMLVIGSSLLISPANMLPGYVDDLIIVNRDDTHMDSMARIVIRDSASIAIPLLKEELSQL